MLYDAFEFMKIFWTMLPDFSIILYIELETNFDFLPNIGILVNIYKLLLEIRNFQFPLTLYSQVLYWVFVRIHCNFSVVWS